MIEDNATFWRSFAGAQDDVPLKNFVSISQKQASGHQSRNYQQALLATGLLLLSNNILALPEDNKQLLQLSAQFADMSQKTHLGIFKGHVEVDQGTTHVRAAKAVTKTNEKNKITEAIIYGNNMAQAHFWTLPAKDKPLFHAYADTIYYYPERHRIELLGNAHIEQGRDSFSAPQISYDTEQHHVLSKSNKLARTTIIIHPENSHIVTQGQP